MTTPVEIECWCATVIMPDGAIRPLGVADSEEGAYSLAAEAIDAISLSLSFGASEQRTEAFDILTETIRIQSAVMLLDEDIARG